MLILFIFSWKEAWSLAINFEGSCHWVQSMRMDMVTFIRDKVKKERKEYERYWRTQKNRALEIMFFNFFKKTFY
jgi:hypothetical protein